MLLAVAVVGVPACALPEVTGDTLPPLDSAPTIAFGSSIPRPPRDQTHDRWYALHDDAIRDHLDGMWALRDQLAQAADDETKAVICTTGPQMEQPAYARAHEAADAHADWIRAVNLTRWMIATCAGGNPATVSEILPELDATLSRFNAWLAGLPPGTC